MTSTMITSRPRTWDESLAAVIDFVASTGRYPTSKTAQAESRLRNWIVTQRRNAGAERVQILDEKLPGWRGGFERRTWEDSLTLTLAYVTAHGKNPAQTDPDHDVARLANWLKAQRMNATAEQTALLDAAIPGWRGSHPGHRPWEESFNALGAFIRRHGRVPRNGNADDEARLRNWADDQRHRARLDAECPGWDTPSYSFESRFEETKAFHVATGRLPRKCDTGDARTLGIWLSDQRQIAGPERRALLDEAFPGWHVTLESQWETTLVGYAGFVEANGRRPRPRGDDAAEVSLARWMEKQRRHRRPCQAPGRHRSGVARSHPGVQYRGGACASGPGRTQCVVNTALHSVPLAIPDSLRRNIRYIKGDRADPWLDGAAALALRLADQWDVLPEVVLEGGAMSLCVLCRCGDGKPAVLKIPANRISGVAESSALAAWNNGVVPGVLTTDEVSGAFLMEFIASGGSKPATDDIAALLSRLHIVAAQEMHPLDAVLQARIRGAATRFAGCPAETADLEIATALIAALQRTADPVMVHGDFQAKNVLHGIAGPVAIDPLPAVGDPYSDLGLWIGGGSAGPRSAALWQYMAASPDPRRLLAWAWAMTVVELREGPATEDAREFIAGHRSVAIESLGVPV